jgi:hypothetical protein
MLKTTQKIIIFDEKDQEHKVIIYWEDWGNCWHAYSESLGADNSPYGDGKTQKEALDDLRWQLDEMK